MDIRLSRTDLDGLLRLIESGQALPAGQGADKGADLHRNGGAAVDKIWSGSSFSPAQSPATVLDAFSCYFDRGVAASDDGASSAGALSQSQLYGTSASLANALRVWTTDTQGNACRSAYMLSSTRAEDGVAQLPTLNEVRDTLSVMTGGGARLAAELDQLARAGVPHLELAETDVVAGDGVVTGSPSLAINSVWLGNHNQWVTRLKSETDGAWSEDEYFEAARIINIAEYQRVVFTEFADAMAARSSGAGAFSVPEAMPFSETIDVIDASGRSRQLTLANMFLGSSDADIVVPSDAAAGRAASPASATHAADELAARLLQFTAGRDDDTRASRPVTLNQIKAELFVLTGLASMRPYDSWADFQGRNGLSDDLIQDLQAAYPEGVGTVDAWFGGLAERPADGQLGATFSALARSALEHQSASEPLLADFLEGLPLKDAIEESTFTGIIERVTGIDGLPPDVMLADASILPGVTDSGSMGILVHGTEAGDIIFGTSGVDTLYGHGGDDILIGDRLSKTLLESGEDDVASLDALLGELGLEGNGDGAPATLIPAVAEATNPGSSDTPDAQLPDPPVLEEASASPQQTAGATDALAESSTTDVADTPDAVEAAAADAPAHDGDWIDGGAGDDILIGSMLGDILVGGLGNDVLAGGDGADAMDGGEGDDLLAGGAGNDDLYGGEGLDSVYGGSGDDSMSGGEGSDELFGGSGSDEIWGDLAGDRDEDDEGFVVNVGSGDYDVVGSSAADMVNTGGGTDTVFAGGGTDIISTGSGQDLVDGGDHDDWIDGGSGNDTISGGRGKDTLFGGSGDDKLYGGSGDDKLYGGSGDDWMEGGSGANSYDGGSGDDWISTVSGRDTIVLQPGFGNDTVVGFDAVSSGSGGQNRIDVSAYGLDQDSFGTDILVLTIGDDTVIRIGTDSLTLLSVNAQTIDRNDFIFS